MQLTKRVEIKSWSTYGLWARLTSISSLEYSKAHSAVIIPTALRLKYISITPVKARDRNAGHGQPRDAYADQLKWLWCWILLLLLSLGQAHRGHNRYSIVRKDTQTSLAAAALLSRKHTARSTPRAKYFHAICSPFRLDPGAIAPLLLSLFTPDNPLGALQMVNTQPGVHLRISCVSS